MKHASNPRTVPEIIVLCVTYLADNVTVMEQFFEFTGSNTDDLAAEITTPTTQAALLDFLLGYEAYVEAFCSTYNLNPEDLWRLRRTLPGGNVPHWT